MHKGTPLRQEHMSIPDAKMVDFHGWEMPLQYGGGIIDEHMCVRSSAGVFDVSHMGEISVRGPESEAFLQWLCTNDVLSMRDGTVRYSPICYPDGGTLDDVLVYRKSPTDFFLVVNASNTEKDLSWISSDNEWMNAGRRVSVEDQSDAWALIAVQGPGSRDVLGACAGASMTDLKPFRFRSGVELFGEEALVSRTGYTGEDGFELYLSPEAAPRVWRGLVRDFGLCPCGLGARDTLRIEACLPLYGQELSELISPIEAGLFRFVRFEKADFCGKRALSELREDPLSRRLFGCQMQEPGVPRTGFDVYVGEEAIGRVTSGAKCPALGTFNAMFLAPKESDSGDMNVEVDIRGRRRTARIVQMPFYRRKSSRGVS